MIGDRLMIYDAETGKFYAGRGRKVFVDKISPPRWTKKIKCAMTSTALIRLREIVEEVGGGARIVSETQARQIVALRERGQA